jgi:nitrate reductase NapAB chaperone NapD
MPIFSYLAYPQPNSKKKLFAELNSLDFCEAQEADNADLLILITETTDDAQEKVLQEKFKNIKSLQSLAMTFGHAGE